MEALTRTQKMTRPYRLSPEGRARIVAAHLGKKRPRRSPRLPTAARPEIVQIVAPVAFSPRAFEKAFGIGHTKLYEEIKAGRLVARKLGVRTIILAEDAIQWARSLPRVGGGYDDG